MLKSNAPAQYVIPWANSGTKNAIPVNSQIGITNGAASFTDGYPPLTFTPIAAGGVPPFGADTNGILYDETLNTLWQQSGFIYAYNSTFSTNQSGYPAQALLSRADGKGLWLNLADNNTTNPDATGSANWTSVRANIGSSTIAVSNGNNTPSASVLGPRLLIITGSISSSASLILPLTSGASWIIQNNTTGAGTLSVQGATGAGVTIAQGTVAEVITDGTNYYTSTFTGAGIYLPINGTAVAATKLATARTFSITGGVNASGISFDGTGNVALNVTAIPGNAATATKLSTARTFYITGGVTASGVSFDGTANVSLNVTAIPGNAATATKWASPINLTLSGITTGTASIDGSGNVTLSTSIADAALSIAKTSGLQSALDGKLSLTGGTLSGVLTINQPGASGYGFSIYGSTLAGASILLSGNGSTTPSKIIGARSGSLVFLSDGGSSMLSISDSGNASFAGSVTASGGFQNSDRRLKTNIVSRDVQRGFALSLANMFCEWDRIADGAHDVGLIAQEVREIAHQYVKEGEDDRKLLAIDKAGIALEASMDNALAIEEIKQRLDKLGV